MAGLVRGFGGLEDQLKKGCIPGCAKRGCKNAHNWGIDYGWGNI